MRQSAISLVTAISVVAQLALGSVLKQRQTSSSSVWDFDADSCDDPSGFQSCWQQVTTQVGDCYGQYCNGATCDDYDNCEPTNSDCLEECTCGAYAEWITCAASYCWNQAHSCAYQQLVVTAKHTCSIWGGTLVNSTNPTVYAPYFPPPPGSTDGCSCNFGLAYWISQLYYDDAVKYCVPEVGATEESCNCCAASGEYSALANVCPGTNPDDIPIWSQIDAVSIGNALMSSTCDAIVATATCTNSFEIATNYPDYPVTQYYLTGQLPGATASVTNVGTMASATAATITWDMGIGITETVVAATGGSQAQPSSGGSSEGSSGSSGSSGSFGSSGSGSFGSGSSGSPGSSGSAESSASSASSSGSSSKQGGSATQTSSSNWPVFVTLVLGGGLGVTAVFL